MSVTGAPDRVLPLAQAAKPCDDRLNPRVPGVLTDVRRTLSPVETVRVEPPIFGPMREEV